MKTKPTIETVLERISALEKKMDERFDKVDERFNKVGGRFDSVDNEIDCVAIIFHSTNAEMLTLRADFREMRAQLKEVLPIQQAS
jgi:DNA anti-recombination protein RmuC